MSQIKLVHSGGNGVIISAPSSNPAANRTITLPGNADGEMLTTNNPKTGNIIQVKQAFKGNTFTTTSSSFVDVTGLSVDITPSNSSNKILVKVFVCGSGRAGYARCVARLMRDSTPIGNSSDPGNRIAAFAQLYPSNDTWSVHTAGIEFLDSPGDTNSHTYKVQIVNGNSSGDTMCINRNYDDSNSSSGHRYSSSITVMEVAA